MRMQLDARRSCWELRMPVMALAVLLSILHMLGVTLGVQGVSVSGGVPPWGGVLTVIGSGFDVGDNGSVAVEVSLCLVLLL